MEISANASTYQHGAARGEKCSHCTNAKHEHIQLNPKSVASKIQRRYHGESWTTNNATAKDLSLRRRMR
eukprot:scaffold69824_cov52-Cyclotella_meneghiniana.AAC.1